MKGEANMNDVYSPTARFCPMCGHSIDKTDSIIVEYWKAEESIYFSWCSKCTWKGEIKTVTRISTTELAEG
jgi:hypothetical protein